MGDLLCTCKYPNVWYHTQHIVNHLGSHATLLFMKWEAADLPGDWRSRRVPIQQHIPCSSRIPGGSSTTTFVRAGDSYCSELGSRQVQEEIMSLSF